jgi:putative redox protein
MQRKNRRVRFPNASGHHLAGIVEIPPVEPSGYAIFSHCFTCTKDLKAIVRISRRLAERGICILRFDFMGLGDSEGDFSHTTFADNRSDLLAAANFMAAEIGAPDMLIGHSLGGAASIAVAPLIDSLRCVVNVASPAHTRHLARHLVSEAQSIETAGDGRVTIGGRTYTIRKPMVEELFHWKHEEAISQLKLPLLIMFSPDDETLPFQHGIDMFRLAGGPVSFVTLDGADHLLVNQPDDAQFVADMIATWSARFLA